MKAKTIEGLVGNKVSTELAGCCLADLAKAKKTITARATTLW